MTSVSPHRQRLDTTAAFSLLAIVVFLGVFVLMFPPLYRPELHRRPAVSLPWTSSAETLQESAHDLWLTVRADGTVYVGPNKIALERLGAVLQMISNEESVARQLVLRADTAAPFPVVRAVLHAASTAGYHEIRIVTFEGQQIEAINRRGAS